MITFKDNVFRLSTKKTSYCFRITPFGHLEHVYYGEKIDQDQDIVPFLHKRTAQLGSCVMYDESDETYSLDTLPLEWSGIGKGDYRLSPVQIKRPGGSYTTDFVYRSHRLLPGTITFPGLPGGYGDEEGCTSLEITLEDLTEKVKVLLCYTVFHEADVIARKTVIVNEGETKLSLQKIMSLQLDLPNDDFQLMTFNGGWIKEAHKQISPLGYGTIVNSSTTGDSSNIHNPGFLIGSAYTTEETGRAYGFNLVYSGNHYGAIERSNHDLVRIQLGINPHCFEWVLEPGERFCTPEAVMTFSGTGYNDLSNNFHRFINHHIVRGNWKNRERPVLLNNWEANFFKFNQEKLLRLARKGKEVGIELFVLDDGWFGARNSDKAGLGDYTVNKKKLPEGLKSYAKKIHELDLLCGLWFEPEMVNYDSDLYRAHPEYALTTPGKKPSLGRNQLVLDLCNPQVRDYIVENVSRILDECEIDYVKWDYNRHISDALSTTLNNQGEFFHRYILGLYEVLERIFIPRPHILFESCSSGGNRFDLGMLCYSPQIWSSDDTDPIERLKIQEGLSYLYPPSTMGAHVSAAPHQQTLRDTPLSTRFNVAAFGSLGYELDLQQLSPVERKEVKAQISFYKRYRRTLQYGTFRRGEHYKDNKVIWHSLAVDQKEAISGFFQTLAGASEGFDRLRIPGLIPESKYRVKTKAQRLFIKRFGGLVKHIMPVTLNPDGVILRTANRHYGLDDCVEEYTLTGALLKDNGILLNNQFVGSYINEHVRILGDFGSSLYVTREVNDEEELRSPE